MAPLFARYSFIRMVLWYAVCEKRCARPWKVLLVYLILLETGAQIAEKGLSMGIKIDKPLRDYTVDTWGDWTEKESYKSLFRGYAKPRWRKGGPSLRAEQAIWMLMKVSKYRDNALRRRIHYIAWIDREEYSTDLWKVDSTIDFIELDGWTVDWDKMVAWVIYCYVLGDDWEDLRQILHNMKVTQHLEDVKNLLRICSAPYRKEKGIV